VGKSSFSNVLADRLRAAGDDAHVIGADKFYLYAGPNTPFMLGTGLTTDDFRPEQPHHLYGILEPTAPCPTPQEYRTLLTQAVEHVHRLGALAIIEGCSKAYTVEACRLYGYDRALYIMDPYGYKSWDPFEAHDKWEEWMTSKIGERLDTLIDLGLYTETEQALDQGYAHTYPLQKGLIYGPIVAALRHQLRRDVARRQIIANWMHAARRSRDFFRSPEHRAEKFACPPKQYS
jgi:tRNA A37 N6-isopentenylltransferase MiaA